MSSNENNTRKRASSAKASNDKARPSSGNSHKGSNKVDLIENIYGNLLSTKRNSNKNIPSKLGSFGDEKGASKVSEIRNLRPKQQLLEQNNQLKRSVNHLKQELNLQKHKIEQMRRKTSQFTKKLNVEYEKQLYWSHGGGVNMLRGVKQQYEQMKLKYEQKCLQCDLLAQQYVLTQSREERAYIQALESENQKLQKRIKQAKQEYKYIKHGTITSNVEDEMDGNTQLKCELNQQNENLREQVLDCKRQSKVLREQVAVRDKKIEYLEKLLIERDNSQHHAWKKLKKLQKEKQQLTIFYAEYKAQKQEQKATLDRKIKQQRQLQQRQAHTQRTIYRNELLQKQDRIAKLQKQIAYLTTLLSYWKPLDQINHLAANKITLPNQSYADEDRQIALQYSMGSTMMKYNPSKQQYLNANDQDYDSKSIVTKSRKGSADNNNNKNVSEVMTKSIVIAKKEQYSKRARITADKRHTQQGSKSRKIHSSEIADICQTLKYRFIGLRIPIQTIKEFFDFRELEEMVESQEEENWKRQYISMRQVKQILMNDVFNLNDVDAHTLSRYLIQDSQNDYVYCDPNNENIRSVIKSIIKTAVGEYELVKDFEKLKKSADDLIQKYHSNLLSALHTTSPKGITSKKKLLQLIRGLGIELSDEIQSYLIGKIVIKSQNLNTLRYSVMFQI